MYMFDVSDLQSNATILRFNHERDENLITYSVSDVVQ